MPRHFWISASIAVLVAAFALFAFALPRLYLLDTAAESPTSQWAQSQIATYSVPPARAEAIRNTLNSVLLNNGGSQQPLGQASLPAPDRLMVSAPAGMQDSIRRAIASLSEGEATAPTMVATATVDIWLVDAVTGAGTDDPQLSAVKSALDQVRQRFGHGHYRLLERSMVLAALDGNTANVSGRLSQAGIQLQPRNADAVEAKVSLMIQGTQPNRFESNILLPEGQWQLVGLLPSSGSGNPERLLLMRQTPAQSGSTQGQ